MRQKIKNALNVYMLPCNSKRLGNYERRIKLAFSSGRDVNIYVVKSGKSYTLKAEYNGKILIVDTFKRDGETF